MGVAGSKGILWAAVATIACSPAAIAGGADDLGVLVDFAGDVPAPTLDVPNPLPLALDAADAAGLALGRHDADRMTLGVEPFAMPVGYPDMMDERSIHGGYFLTFTESSEMLLLAVSRAAVWAKDDNHLGAVPSPDRATIEAAPRVFLAVDAAALRVGTQVQMHQATDGAPALGSAGVGLVPVASGAPGFAAALPLDGIVAAQGADPAAPLTPWSLPPEAAASAAAQGAGPALVAPAAPDAGVAAGLAAAGLLLGGLALYHLVNRNNIFENDVRMQVYDTVARNPGVTIQEVARVVGLSHPTARYHLNVLAKNDLVVFLDKGNKMMFFRNRNEFSEPEREMVAILRNPEAMRVYQRIEESPWVLRKELSAMLAISRTSVNWHLRNLMRAGLVTETREQGKGFLFVRREGREMLVRVGQRVPDGAAAPAGPPAPVAVVPVTSHQQTA